MKTIKMFYADWCGPCKMTKPIVRQIEEEYQVRVDYINIDVFKDITLSFGIKSIPTLVFFEDGEEYNRCTGYQAKERILQYFNNEV
jgi:thioredoxin 1